MTGILIVEKILVTINIFAISLLLNFIICNPPFKKYFYQKKNNNTKNKKAIKAFLFLYIIIILFCNYIIN
jgi:hypothetical protein